MYRLSSLILLILGVNLLSGQSPHGDLFKIDCAACHNPSGWSLSDSTMTFQHASTGFDLTGGHSNIDCKSCHVSLIFSEVSDKCASCHTDIHSMSLGNDCARCHNTEIWLLDDIPQLHEKSGFPLIGAHNVLNCVDCHTSDSGLRFDPIGNDCINCHNADFDATISPNHNSLNLSKNCIECHNPLEDGWNTDIINHDFFPLTEGHDIQDCKICHINPTFSDISSECVSCHQKNFDETEAPNHLAANFSTDCIQCHTPSLDWTPAIFTDHDQLYFPIYSGKHNGEWMDCMDCHSNQNNFKEYNCINCHLNPETDQAHSGVNGYLYQDNACLACHPNGDAENTFDHDQTGFPLTGGHLGQECIACHENGFVNTSTECVDCHIIDFNNSLNPSHTDLGISTDCIACHTTDPGWAPASFDIHDNYYPLEGAHATIANECINCHNGDYNNTPNTCAGCHQQDYSESINPNHVDLNLSTDCVSCHTTNPGWSPALFEDHNAFYPLNGAHAAIANNCLECHSNGYNNTPNTCVGCHLDDFNGTTNPDHPEAGFPTDCIQCHNEGAWSPALFDHNAFYPLNGAHAAIANNCIECHSNGYTNTPNTCVGCHLDDFNGTTNPDHPEAGFPTDCIQCHNEGAWTPALFDHNAFYPLNGAHAAIANNCVECHSNGYNNTPNTCVGCHLDDFNGTTNPDHPEAGFPTDCIQCHNEGAWTPALFDHNAFYPLNGAHAAIANNCVECHSNGYNNTPNTCVGCHLDDFNGTTNPDHPEAGLPTDCIQCHNEGAWTPALFDHNSFYPLNGAHAAIANNCVECHSNGYTNTPNTCVGCHLDDFNGTTNPDHPEAGFPTDCIQCHNEGAWSPALFDHNAFYPLNGAHAAIANNCVECHSNGYNNTPNTCVGCHLSDYNNTNDPDHQSANFPTDCIQCHNEGAWSPALFDHNAFYPLNGAHAAIANNCVECHSNGYNNTPNTCVGCHLSDYNNTNDPDHQSANFPTDCIQCHNEGAWSPASFDHNAFYPLNGAHAAIANNCVECHSNGYNNTPNTCVGCHLSDYNNTNDPDHQSANFPTDCIQCHNEGAWSPASFDHDAQYFPIYSGKHRREWNNCTDCHINSSSYAILSCINCHEHNNRNEVDNDHDEVSGYSYQSNACYSCHPNGDN